MRKTIAMVATMIACVALNAAKAAPLPEAKPDDVGFSQQGLAGSTIFSPARSPQSAYPAPSSR